jgi:multidrug efflux system membrane fusion protein
VTIAKYDPIYVKFHLQERDLRQLKQSLAAGLSTSPRFRSPTRASRKGHISFYDNTVDTASGTILAKAKFENAFRRAVARPVGQHRRAFQQQ